MTEEDRSYVEEVLKKCLEGSSSIQTLVTKRLIGIINKETDNDPIGYMLSAHDFTETTMPKEDVVIDTDVMDLTDMTRDSLTTLLTIIL